MSRITKDEIQKQLVEEYIKWSKEPFDSVTLPEDIIEKFEKALFLTPPDKDKMSLTDIRTILNRTPQTLTRMEVGIVTNVILAVPRNVLYKNLNDWLVNGSQYSHIRDKFNEAEKEKSDYLNRKGESLARISNLK